MSHGARVDAIRSCKIFVMAQECTYEIRVVSELEKNLQWGKNARTKSL